MSSKIFVCRCEDVTLAEVEHAVALGYDNLEEVKRYTGFGTGPCQGKECHALVAGALGRLAPDAPLPTPFTARPPLGPVCFAELAALDDDK